jgi:hypothetical protein
VRKPVQVQIVLDTNTCAQGVSRRRDDDAALHSETVSEYVEIFVIYPVYTMSTHQNKRLGQSGDECVHADEKRRSDETRTGNPT